MAGDTLCMKFSVFNVSLDFNSRSFHRLSSGVGLLRTEASNLGIFLNARFLLLSTSLIQRENG